MIRPRYSLKLARTKLRSKRGMLLASIIVASLLFAALIASVIVFSGAEKSALSFVEKAGNDRYLVKVTPVVPYEKISFSNDLSLDDIREIKAFEKQYYNDLHAKYMSLGLEYDARSEVSALQPAAWRSENLPEEQRVSINFQSPALAALTAQKYAEFAKTTKNKLSDLKLIGEKYGADRKSVV